MSRLVASRTLLISIVAGVAWVLLWAWLTRTGGPVSTLFFPSPEAVFQRFLRMWSRPYLGSTLLEHIVSSLSIVLAGWAVAGIVGVLGVLIDTIVQRSETLVLPWRKTLARTDGH